jgi:DNA-binding CsgD family transcriptional regulator/tetratricopeptide (TPR) repeat protein
MAAASLCVSAFAASRHRSSVPRIDARRDRSTLPSSGGARTQLFGRARECRALDELLSAVRGGHARALVLRGDAGIGKTALLHHVLDAADGFRIVRANGVESEMAMPFAALHQLCGSMLVRLDQLPDPQRDAASSAFGLVAGQGPERLLIGLAVLNLLADAASDAPLLCIVDDAQWLDRESAQALAFVARRLLADPVALIFATRAPVADFASLPELRVERLLDGDAQTLLSSVLHVPLDERVRDRIVAETQGNPLAIVELPRGLSPAELAGGFGLPAKTAMTGQIEERFRQRVVELPSATQRFLTVAAAEPTGDPVLVWRAANALGVEPNDATPAIDANLVDIGVRVWFRHPIVRSAAYGGATMEERHAAHRALADATDASVDPDRRAWHRALGAAGPDDEIADELEQSADRARARGGVAAAAMMLERAVTLTVDPSRRAQRLIAAAAAHLEAGSFDRAAGLLASAEASAPDESSEAMIELLRARYAMFGGDVREGPDLLLGAAQRLEHLDPAVAVITHLAAMGACHLVGDLSLGVRTRAAAEAALQCAVPPDPTLPDWLLSGLAQLVVDGPAKAAPALRSSLAAPADAAPQCLGYHAVAALALWDFERFQELAALQVTVSRESGALSTLPLALNVLADAHLLEGDLDAAAAALAEARAIVVETGSNLFVWSAALLAARRGDAAATARIDDQTVRARAVGAGVDVASAELARVLLGISQGQYEQALAAGVVAMRYPWQQGQQPYYADVIEAAVRGGDPAVARDMLDRLSESAEAGASEWALGVLRRSEALLADSSTAEDLYREALTRLGRTTLRPELARAHLLYGEWLRRENRRLDAREHLRIAHELLSAMGMHGFAARAQRELAATGETVRSRVAGAVDALTPQEGQIARLAADGLTNPEIGAQLFISARTVEWHLRKVFSKLGVTSRRGLRDALPRPSTSA